MIAMILAAGRGERLRPITESTPKALVEIGGTTLIERHLLRLAAAGFATVVINLGWLGARIAERLGSGARYGVDIVYSNEGEDILETGGGIRRALPLLGSAPFLVVNADIWTDLPLPPPSPADDDLGHLVLVPSAPEHRGDFALSDGRIRARGEPRHTFSGVAVYRPALFEPHAPGRFPLAPLLYAAAADDRLAGSLWAGAWADAGTPERLAELRQRAGRSTP